jgi:hypothetical protein
LRFIKIDLSSPKIAAIVGRVAEAALKVSFQTPA